MPRIFISYRRVDSLKDAGRIYDRLVEAFGKENVFKDVDSIPIGKDFRGVLREAVAKCDVQLVIIGKSWLTVTDESGGRRLDNPADFVRIEVETALQRDSCLVIPVRVDNAPMPRADDLPLVLRELSFKNAAVVRDDPDFHPDVTKIIRSLGGAETGKSKTAADTAFDVHDAISRFYKAFDERAWDQARTLLTEIRASGKAPRVFNVDTHESEIWTTIAEQERDKEYEVLRLMARRAHPTGIWEALQVFWQAYPDYDPDDLARFRPAPPAPAPKRKISFEPPFSAPKRKTSLELLPAPFAWIEIPKKGYSIAKYPLTNAQYKPFVDAGGYRDQRWWTAEGWQQREKNNWAEPRFWNDTTWNGAEHPVVGVSWFEATAYCLWLSDVMGEKIMLPTEVQWQYAAQGDDGREYPWGIEWDANRCNNNVDNKGIGKTTPVRQYEGKGDSPFGLVDMAGNVWEWCLTSYDEQSNDINMTTKYRLLRGGSWFNSSPTLLRAAIRLRSIPDYAYDYYGFRCVRSR